MDWQNQNSLEYKQILKCIINCVDSNGTVFVKGLRKIV